ncbi:MAG: DUF4192 domain-containing protein [Micromonosporaceae bacterium]
MNVTPSDFAVPLRSPEEALAAVPYLLGFHPSDSVVLVGLDNQVVAFTARADLPPPDDAAAVRQIARMLAGLAVRQQVTDVVIIGYGPTFHVDPAVLEAELMLSTEGFGVPDVLRVEGDRYWSYLCDGCCPAEGHPFDVASSEFAATATLAGRVALPDRETLEQQVAPVTGDEQAAMRTALAHAAVRLSEALTSGAARDGAAPPAAGTGASAPASAGDGARPARGGSGGGGDGVGARREVVRDGERELDRALARVADGGRLDDEAVAWLATLLTVEEFCERAWRRTALACEPARPDRITPPGMRGVARHGARRGSVSRSTSSAREYLELWRELTRRAAPSPAAAALMGYAAWLTGQGPLAWAATQRALAAPGYFPARVMAEVLASGVPPDVVVEKMRQQDATKAAGSGLHRRRRRRRRST